jgi:hypothetical protein
MQFRTRYCQYYSKSLTKPQITYNQAEEKNYLNDTAEKPYGGSVMQLGNFK